MYTGYLLPIVKIKRERGRENRERKEREQEREKKRVRESEQPTINKIEIDTKTARKSISKNKKPS